VCAGATLGATTDGRSCVGRDLVGGIQDRQNMSETDIPEEISKVLGEFPVEAHARIRVVCVYELELTPRRL
jgi:hypothetical protein